MNKFYRVIGIESSPYAVKVRAVMRYRRLPHLWVARMPQFYAETAKVRPLIMPVVQFLDGEYYTDSTPIIRELELRHPEARSVLPPDPAARFLCDLIEDLADEWLSKSLFHYRFGNARDQKSGATWVMDDAHPHLAHDELAHKAEAFMKRQISRMPMVGCTPQNAPLLESFFVQLIGILEDFVATDRFLFGTRPSLADFALYGQLATLARDPTPMAILMSKAPRTLHWVRRLDDTSGVDGQWDFDVTKPPAVVTKLCHLAGKHYLPFLHANRVAIEHGDAMLSLEIDAQRFQQEPYRYQKKCYEYLLHCYKRLPDPARAQLSLLLTSSGCARYF